jgi:hypothetical protein
MLAPILIFIGVVVVIAAYLAFIHRWLNHNDNS